MLGCVGGVAILLKLSSASARPSSWWMRRYWSGGWDGKMISSERGQRGAAFGLLLRTLRALEPSEFDDRTLFTRRVTWNGIVATSDVIDNDNRKG